MQGRSPEADAVLSELEALEDPKIRAVNARHGDDHGVNLTRLRAVAKSAGRDQSLAAELWKSGETAGRLVSLLMFRPRALTQEQLDAMLREARVPKVHDWLVNYLAKKSTALPALRALWVNDADPVVGSAGWALTSYVIAKDATAFEGTQHPDGIDLEVLLQRIDAELVDAPERLQWAMNECLAQIGIHHADLRNRALEIGERLGVLRDYPTPPGCTSPFAPIWITEMVRRSGSSA